MFKELGSFIERLYNSLDKFLRRILQVDFTFKIPHTLDLERFERCRVHFAALDCRIIPFYASNTLYRPQLERVKRSATELGEALQTEVTEHLISNLTLII